MVSLHSEVPSSGVAAFIGFAAQAKRRSVLPFGFNPDDATGTQGARRVKVCGLHRHLLGHFVGYDVLNLCSTMTY